MPVAIHIGFGSYIVASQVVGITDYSSAPIRRFVSEGRDRNITIDMTGGRSTKSIIFMSNGNVVLSPMSPDVLAKRINT